MNRASSTPCRRTTGGTSGWTRVALWISPEVMEPGGSEDVVLQGVALAREPAEALAQAVIERRPGDLREHAIRQPEFDVDVLAGRNLQGRAAVDVHLDRLLTRGVVDGQLVVRRDHERTGGK